MKHLLVFFFVSGQSIGMKTRKTRCQTAPGIQFPEKNAKKWKRRSRDKVSGKGESQFIKLHLCSSSINSVVLKMSHFMPPSPVLASFFPITRCLSILGRAQRPQLSFFFCSTCRFLCFFLLSFSRGSPASHVAVFLSSPYRRFGFVTSTLPLWPTSSVAVLSRVSRTLSSIWFLF